MIIIIAISLTQTSNRCLDKRSEGRGFVFFTFFFRTARTNFLMISCSSTGVISSISLFSSQTPRYSLKTFMSYKVFFFVFSFSSFSVNSLTSKSLMDANLPLPLTGEVLISSANSSDKARLDVSARGFWQKGQRTFFDVRVL